MDVLLLFAKCKQCPIISLTGNQYSLSISNKICVCLLKRYFDIRFKGEESQFFGKVVFFLHYQIALTCTVYRLFFFFFFLYQTLEQEPANLVDGLMIDFLFFVSFVFFFFFASHAPSCLVCYTASLLLFPLPIVPRALSFSLSPALPTIKRGL